MKNIKKFITIGMITTILTILVSCGGSSTLEEYVNDNSDVQQSIESMEKTIGENGSVTIKENNLTITYAMPNTYDEATLAAVKEQMEKYLSSMDSSFQNFEDQLKEESGVDKATVTINYTDASGNEIYSKIYK